jgi:hypothetical protein
VVTTAAFTYLTTEARQEFMQILDDASYHRDIAWLSAENQGTVGPFVAEAEVPEDQAMSYMLGAVLFKKGGRRGQLLAYVQEHGAWIDWRAPKEADGALA